MVTLRTMTKVNEYPPYQIQLLNICLLMDTYQNALSSLATYDSVYPCLLDNSIQLPLWSAHNWCIVQFVFFQTKLF
jgi:hypothetical protein